MKQLFRLLAALAVAFVAMFVTKSASAQYKYREVICGDGPGLCIMFEDHVPADIIVRVYDGVYRKALEDVGELEPGEHLTAEKIFRADKNREKLIPVCLDERGLAKRVGSRGDESVWRNCDRPTWVPVPKMRIRIPTEQMVSYETSKAFYLDVRRCFKSGSCAIETVLALFKGEKPSDSSKPPAGTPTVDPKASTAPQADSSDEIAQLKTRVNELETANAALTTANAALTSERDAALGELSELKNNGTTGEVSRLRTLLEGRPTNAALYRVGFGGGGGGIVLGVLCGLMIARRRRGTDTDRVSDSGSFTQDAAQRIALKEASIGSFDPSKTTKKNLSPPGMKPKESVPQVSATSRPMTLSELGAKEFAAERRKNGLNVTVNVDDEPPKTKALPAKPEELLVATHEARAVASAEEASKLRKENASLKAKIADLEKKLVEADELSAKNGNELNEKERKLQEEIRAADAARRQLSEMGNARSKVEQDLASLRMSVVRWDGIDAKFNDLRAAWHAMDRAVAAQSGPSEEDPLSRIGVADDPKLGGQPRHAPPLSPEVAQANFHTALAAVINEGITVEKVSASLKDWYAPLAPPHSGPFESDHMVGIDTGARLSQPGLPAGMAFDNEKTTVFNVDELRLTEDQKAAVRRETQGFNAASWAQDPAVAAKLNKAREVVPRAPYVVGDPNNRPVRSSTDKPPALDASTLPMPATPATEPSVGGVHLMSHRSGKTLPPPPSVARPNPVPASADNGNGTEDEGDRITLADPSAIARSGVLPGAGEADPPLAQAGDKN